MPKTVPRTARRPSRLRRAALALLLPASLCALPAAANAEPDRAIRLVTQNMAVGSAFDELGAAQSPQALLAAVATVYTRILATRPAERAAAMAREIAQRRPDLVALQEAALLRTGTSGPATVVQMDLLQSLLDELAALGHRYRAVAILPGFDAQAPSALGFNVRITMQDAILVRSDLPSDDIRWSNLQIERFGNQLVVPSIAGPIADPRGWAGIDVSMRGSRFRFVTTHLDSVVPTIRVAQATELLHSALDTKLPVILAGDTNIAADTALDPAYAGYQAMLEAGLTDAWLLRRTADQGFTCCQTEGLANPASTLSHRVDLVVFRGPFTVTDIGLIGEQPFDRTASGLWPSDHAGVAAVLRLSHD